MSHIDGADLSEIKRTAKALKLTLTPDTTSSRQLLITDRFGEQLGDLNFNRGTIVEAYLGGERMTTATAAPTPLVSVVVERLEQYPTAIARRKASK